ncbi:diaminopimelate epimerase [Bacillus sp. 1P06AnD]|uniref:diaminopimelate epimerase n=1 Tax=Bacillus sp. 1P06AnD TaxID=3132208 RepID=UPI00399F0156
MNIKAIKCHGSGNDFLLIDEFNKALNMADSERASMAKKLCDRSRGLGADGILYFQNSEVADGRMRVFNSDGSEASMCGNGLRCVARYACELLGKQKLAIETMKAVLEVEEMEPIADQVKTYKVEISPVSFNTGDLPMLIDGETFINQSLKNCGELLWTAVAVPNPHLISIVGQSVMESDLQKEIAVYLNGDNPYFPDGVNVSFVEIKDEQAIFVRTFERGVGFTNACGTAMSASSLVTCMQGLNEYEKDITVYNPGGKVKCNVHNMDGLFTIDLIGNATYEYTVDIDYTSADFSEIGRKEYPEEKRAYDAMVSSISKK